MGPSRSKRNFDFYALEDRVLLSGESIDVEGETIETGDLSAALMADLSAEGHALTDVSVVPAVPVASPDPQNDTIDPANDDIASPPTFDPALSVEVIFVDAGVQDADALIDELRDTRDAQTQWWVVRLAADQDGVQQITDALASVSGVDAVHIFSHADDGSVQLGNSRLDTQTSFSHAGDIALWRHSLDADAELLIYGCNLESTQEGQDLVEMLAAVCDCNVAATETLESLEDAESLEHSELLLVTNPLQPYSSNQIVFVDTTVQEYEQLVADLVAQVETGRVLEIVLLDSERDGIAQITETLSVMDEIDAVHFVTHGTDRAVKLGGTWLQLDNLASYHSQLERWGNALSGSADLLFYGCDFAAGSEGQQILSSIRLQLGVDVAASVDTTGNARLGGNWELEYTLGSIETEIVFSDDLQQQWNGVLDTFIVTNTNDSGAGSLRQAINDANALVGLDTITFNVGGGGAQTITVTSQLTDISDAVIIDATTQSGFSGSPLITLTKAGAVSDGFRLAAGSDGSTIEGFVIHGFDGDGIEILSNNNLIAGNYIGTDATGTTAVANDHGIRINGGTDNTIGGMSASARNVLSGNTNDGLRIENGASGTNVLGNYIGTNAMGTGAVGNGDDGVSVMAGTTNNTIGGSSTAARNIISGNGGAGIYLEGTNTVVQGNYLGTDVTGTLDLGNTKILTGEGSIRIWNVSGATIGGTAVGEGNIIAFGGGDGVLLQGSSTGVAILGNSIHSHVGLGIDLGDDGSTANDGELTATPDQDVGANNLQNYPVLSSVFSGPTPTILGSLKSTPSRSFRVEFFASTTADGTNYGEGHRYLGFVNVFTDSVGNASLSTTLSQSISTGESISATATDLTTNETSEFALNVTATNSAPVLTPYTPTYSSVEDADSFSTNVSAFISSSVSDADTGAVKGVAVTAITGISATLRYSLDGGTTWLTFNSLSQASALLLRSTDLIQFTPPTDNGGALTIDYRAWDQTSGVAGNYADTTSNGGSTAFSTASDQIIVNTTSINDAPIAVNDHPGISFDGVDDYVNLGSDPDVVFTNTMTMELWARPTSYPAASSILLNKEGEYEIGVSSTGSLKWAFANSDPSWSWHDTGYVLQLNAWAHISVTYDNGTITTYVNGHHVETYEGSGSIGDSYADKNDLRVGGRENNPAGQYFSGDIDDVRLWSTVRTQSEIQDNLDVELTGAEIGLVGYWNFNEGSGVDANDLTGRSAPGTLTGGPLWTGFRTDQETPISIAASSGLLQNDVDVDGDSLTVSQVQGSGLNVGSQTVIASGALVKVNADGSFDYDPNGVFDYLADGETATDTFSYAVSDGNGGTDLANASVTITGFNDAPLLTNAIIVNLAGTNEDTPSTGTLVSSVYASAGGDDADSGSLAGIAVTSTTGNGTWQFSIDGTNWNDFGVVTPESALLLAGTTQVRYSPDTFNGETAQFGFVAWDQTAGSPSTSGSPRYGDSRAAGTTEAHSTETAFASTVITPVNDVIVAVADAGSAVEAGGVSNATAGSNATGNVLDNDQEVDVGDTPTVIGVQAGMVASATGSVASAVDGTYGSLTVNADGSYTYVVDDSNAIVQALRSVGDSITDTFTYTVEDSGGAMSSAQIVLTITGQNDAPGAAPNNVVAIETGGPNNDIGGNDPTGNVLTNDIDPDAGDTKTVIGVDAGTTASASGDVGSSVLGSYGSITINADGTYWYVVDNNDATVQALRTSGDTITDIFTYTMHDTDGLTSTTQVTVTIQGNNDDPTAADDSIAAVEAGGDANGTAGINPTGNVLANDTDLDSGESQSIFGVAAGSQASASGNVGSAVNGSYGTITIDAGGNFSFVVDNSNAAVQALRTSGDTLGEVFTYTMQDAAGAKSTAEVTVTISGTNDAPVAVANVATAIEASGIFNNISGTDPSGNVLTNDTDVDTGDTKTVVGVGVGVQASTTGNVATTVAGAYGEIAISADGSYTYTLDNDNADVEALNSGETLNETFSYTVRDSDGLESTTQIVVTIDGRTDSPVAIADQATAVEAGGSNNGFPGNDPSGNVLDNDVSGNGKQIVGVAVGSTGTASGSVGVAVTGNYGSVVINDDGTYTYSLDNSNPAVEALLTSGDHVTDIFTYTMEDVFNNSSSTELTITIDGVNDAPIAFGDTNTATEDGGIANGSPGSDAVGNVLANDTDVDSGDTQSVDGVAAGSVASPTGSVGASVVGTYGSIVINSDGSYVYTIDENNAYVAALRTSADKLTEVFSYAMSDTAGAVAGAELIITIEGSNDAPVAIADTANAIESGGVDDGSPGVDPTGNVLTNDADDDLGDTQVVTGVAAGTVAFASGSVGTSVSGNFGSLNIDVDGNYTYTVNNSDAAVKALRTSGQMLNDVFTYTIEDGGGLSSSTQITVSIAGANDIINAVADTATAVEAGGTANGDVGTNPAGNVLANDTDDDAGDTMSISGVAVGVVSSANTNVGSSLAGLYGSINIAADGSYNYTVDNSNPNVQALLSSADTLTDTFTYSAEDTAGGVSTAQIIVTIQGADDAPVAFANFGTAIESGGVANATVGSSATGNVTANDDPVDAGDTTNVTGVGVGTLSSTSGSVNESVSGNYGAITIDASGNYIYLVDENNAAVQALRTTSDTLTDVFSNTIQDGSGKQSTTQISIIVQGQNDAPVAVADTAMAFEAGGIANGTPGSNPSGNVLTNDTDVDSSDTKNVAGVVAGTAASANGNVGADVTGSYGDINIDSNGNYTYTVDNSHAAVEALRNSSETIEDVFTYTTVDASGATSTVQISITIGGQNDQPIITVGGGDSIAETITETDTPLTTSGTLTVSDVDLTDVVTSTVSGVTATGDTTGLQSDNVALLAMLTSTPTVLDGTEQTDSLTWNFDSGSESFDYLAVGESLTITYTITVTDSQGASDTQDVVVTINGTNDDPIIDTQVGDSNSATLIETDGTQIDSGTLSVMDFDLSDIVASAPTNVVAGGTTTGLQSDNAALLAMLTSTPTVLDGTEQTDSLTWNFDSGSESFDYLAVGESLTITYTITVTDSQGASDTQDVVVTINGTNDDPIIDTQVGDSNSATFIETDGTQIDSGTLSVMDFDLSDIVTSAPTNVFAGGTTTGLQSDNAALLAMLTSTPTVLDGTEQTDSLTWNFDSGSESFDYLAVGESLTITYTIAVTDSQGASDTQDVVVTINGSNDGPVAVADATTAVEAGGVVNGTPGSDGSGNVLSNDTDIDNGDTKTVVGVVAGSAGSAVGNVGGSVIGSFGSIAIDASGSFTYDIDQNNTSVQALRNSSETLTDVFTYTMSDAEGSTNTAEVTVTISGQNDSPHAIVVTGLTMAENVPNNTVVGNASSSDVDAGDTATYTLVDDDEGRFGIDAASGDIFVKDTTRISFETSDVHFITIRVTDTLGGFYNETFQIEVDDVNEFDVTIPIDSDANINRVAENSANGTSVGVVAFSEDQDGATNTVRYVLADDDSGRFAIDQDSGVVTVAGLINFEADGSNRTIIVEASSSDGSTSVQAFVIMIDDVNEAPNATGESYSTTVATSLNVGATTGVISNDSDIDGDPLTAIVVTPTSNGTLTLSADGSLVYTPNSGFYGTDSFTYRADDGSLQSDVVQVTISVMAVASQDPNTDPPADQQNDSGNPNADSPVPTIGPDVSNRAETSEVFVVDATTETVVIASLNGRQPNFRFNPSEATNRFTSETGGSASATNTSLTANEAIESTSLSGLPLLDFQPTLQWIDWQSDEQVIEDVAGGIVVGGASTAAGLVSIGYVLWALRGGAFMTAVASSLPSWRIVDPTALLSAYRSSGPVGSDDVDEMID